MNKLSTLLVSLALPVTAMAQVQQVPYSSELHDDASWTTINVEPNSKTWVSETSSTTYKAADGAAGGVKYTYDRAYAADDWYVSPAVHLVAGKEYKLKLWSKTNSSKENYAVVLAPGNTTAVLSGGKRLLDKNNYSNSTWVKDAVTFTVDSTGDYNFALYCYSVADRYNVYCTKFWVGENILTPGAVTGLTATEGENNALTVALKWTLPTTDDDGAALPEGKAVTGVKVYRDGKLAATLDGAATAFTDDAANGLTAGFHTYAVEALIGDAVSAQATVRTKYVGPVEAQAIPWSSDFSTQDAFDALWTVVKGEKSGASASWSLYTNTNSGNAAKLYVGSGKTEDDWLITPPLKFDKAGAYKVTINARYGSSKTNFQVCLGKGKTAADFTTVIDSITSMPYTATDYPMLFEVPEAGTYYIGLHAATARSSYSTYYVSSVKVAEEVVTPQQVADPTATIDGNTIKVAWTNPSKDVIGKDLARLTKVEVYRDGELKISFANPTPGSKGKWTDEAPANGINTYWVIAYNENGAAQGDTVKAASKWFGDPTQTLPYSYDFKDAKLFGLYTAVDQNNDGYTWTYKNQAAQLLKSSDDYSKADDYLLTPPFNLEPGYYKLSFKANGPRYSTMSSGIVSDINNAKGTFTGAQKVTTMAYAAAASNVIKVDTAGTYHFAWYCNESFAKTDANMAVSDISIEKVTVVPGVATDLKVTPDPNMLLKATFEWTNPTGTNVEGVAADNLVKAVILRNGVAIDSITTGLKPGETSQYVDTTVPEAGTYTYSVEIYNAAGKSQSKAPTVESEWIGAGKNVPYTADYADWSIFNVNNDKNTWGDEITWNRNSDNSKVYIMSNNNTPNDWAISPRINFVEGNTYIITVKSWTGMDGEPPYTWNLAYGSAPKPESMTGTLKTITTTVKNAADAQTDTIVVKAVLELPTDSVSTQDADSASELVILAGVRTIGYHAVNKGAVQIGEMTITEKRKPSTGISSIEQAGAVTYAAGKATFAATAQSVVVCDLSGKVVAEAANADSISLDGLNAGVYVISAKIGGKRVVCKVIK